MKVASPHRKRIALLVETSLGSGREILLGISRFSKKIGDWEIYHSARGLEEGVPSWLEEWQGDGIIARVQDAEMVSALKKKRVPVVDVLGLTEHGFPLVHVDDFSISRQVVGHFVEREFVHFGFYGIEGENWSQRRELAFCENAAEVGSVASLNAKRGEAEGGGEQFVELQRWLETLPKPAGVMVCSDQRGLMLLEACRSAGIIVPEQVAVVGVDNDLALCEVSTPNLSSVRGGHRRVGFEAASLLNQLIEGEDPPREAILIPPNDIVVRESSDSRSFGDPAVRKAVQFVREQLGDEITNDDISKAAGLSKTRLQLRFQEALEMSLRGYLLERRLIRAELLITSTDLSFAEIAGRCGFKHQEYLGYVLKKERGVTPGQLRKRDGA